MVKSINNLSIIYGLLYVNTDEAVIKKGLCCFSKKYNSV